MLCYSVNRLTKYRHLYERGTCLREPFFLRLMLSWILYAMAFSLFTAITQLT